ncbi:MAG: NAD(P)H-dependent oxidoreductase subunit E, partial [Alphaproteobacteria bacterium]|nr:NAD(P)H-dependent oxidoreductase subunit E [Alphaproteobacteria bacterium]
MADINSDKRFDIHEIAKNKNAELERYRCSIYCCHSTGCKSSGSDSIIDILKDAIAEHGIEDQVRIVATGCMGLCAQGPLIRVEVKGQKDVLYKRIEPLVARLVVTEHVVPALKMAEGEEYVLPAFLQEHVLSLDLPFFTKQEKVVLRDAGHMDPEDIQEYIARGGYLALEKVLKTMKPSDVVEEIKKSGLRGRGGGGFSTGMKWELAAKVPTIDEKFIICNGDEGDPGAYMDRSILEGDPHSVIEGMMIAAYAIGATQGWFYVRAEYPLAVERLDKAIKACKKNRLLGNNIMGTDFSFNIEIGLGAGAFVCGEETALIHSIEGKRGTPRPRPPYPTNKGLWNKPSCVNNVETLGNITKIILKGADWFASFGTATSKGTKVFALTGQVEHSGLIEVPMGTTINEIVNEIGGGVPNGK